MHDSPPPSLHPGEPHGVEPVPASQAAVSPLIPPRWVPWLVVGCNVAWAARESLPEGHWGHPVASFAVALCSSLGLLSGGAVRKAR